MQYTPDKYIVVPQPGGSSGGPLSANDITVNLAKSLTQARANSEGDFSVVDTIFQDDRQDVGNIKLPKGGSQIEDDVAANRVKKSTKDAAGLTAAAGLGVDADVDN